MPKEISRKNYPNFDQSVLAEEDKWKKTLCAPVAALNAIYRIQEEQKFIPNFKTNDPNYARKLMQDLALECKTQATDGNDPGTSPANLVSGIESFFKKFGKKLKFIEWRGWGAGQIENGKINKAPKFNWIAKQLNKTHREVLLHVGMYKRVAGNKLKRVFGHFVTATGFIKKNLQLKINDPSPRANQSDQNSSSRPERTVQLKTLKEGEFEAGNKTTQAKGYEQLEGLELNTDVGAEIAVIDGALAFEVANS